MSFGKGFVFLCILFLVKTILAGVCVWLGLEPSSEVMFSIVAWWIPAIVNFLFFLSFRFFSKADFTVSCRLSGRDLLQSILFTFFLFIVLSVVAYLPEIIESFKETGIVCFLPALDSEIESYSYFVTLFALIVLAPVSEELVYRRLFLESFLREGYKPWKAIVFLSLFFALGHLGKTHEPLALLSIFFFGLFVGYLYYLTRKVVLVILLHMEYNLLIEGKMYFLRGVEFHLYEVVLLFLISSVVLYFGLQWFGRNKRSSLAEFSKE